MLLFALFLNSLICLLERQITGIRIWRRTTKTAVVTYGDVVTSFMTTPADIQIIGDLLLTYDRATGVPLNIRKTKAMAEGSWDTSINMMDILHNPEITILGFRFTSTVAYSGNATCSRATGKVKTLARDAYGKGLCLKQRTHSVHTFLLSNIQHTELILPTPKQQVRQLLTAISWYIWRGAIFSVPLSTLQRLTEDWSMDLIHVAAKCRALFVTRFWVHGERDGSLTAQWLNVWASLSPRMNPQPAHKCDPLDIVITTHLFSRMDVYGTPEAGRNRAGLQTKGVWHLRSLNNGRCASCTFSQPLTGH